MQKRKWIRTLACTLAVLLLTQNQGIVYATEVSQTENSVQNEEEPVKEEPDESEENDGVKQDEEEKNSSEDSESETENEQETDGESGTEDPETETDDESAPEDSEIGTDDESDPEDSETEADGEQESEEDTGESVEDTAVSDEAVVDETGEVKDSLLKAVDETENVILTEAADDIFIYDGEKTITGLKDGATVTDLVIPEGICEISSNAFSGKTSITSVLLPESLEKIESYAFRETGITKITIPKNVTKIDACAFIGCSNLKEVEIQTAKLNECGYSIFENCSINTITLSSEMTTVPGWLFQKAGLESGTTVTIPASVEAIGESAFDTAGNLSGVTFEGNAVREIGASAFARTGITEVTMPESVQSIESYAFVGTKIAKITIPKNVTKLDACAFNGCSNLKEVEIQTTKLQKCGYSIFEGCNINKITLSSEMTTVPAMLFHKAGLEYGTTVSIPASVVAIGESAFDTAGNLSGVTFEGNAVREIGASAFARTPITEVTIPDNVTTIGTYAFNGCSQLTSVNIQSTKLASTETNIFSGCNIKDITLPEGMVKIPNCLFCGAGVQYDTEVTIPASVEIIGNFAFKGVDKLCKINFAGNKVREIGESAFEGTGIAEVVIPENVTTIGMYAFKNCSQVTSVNIQSTKLSSTRTSIYSGCNIKDITLPEGMVKIPNCLFCGAGVQYDTEVTIPASVEIIGDHAFSGLDKLCKINFAGNKVREIGESAFEKTGITEVIIPGNVKTIDWYAFRGCSSLVKVVIPSSVTSIGYGAFANCNSEIKFYVTSGSYASKWAADNKLGIVTNYSIKYNLNGGTNAADNPYVYETGESIEFSAPTRKGYTFEGWYKDSTFKKKIENTESASGNLNLYAKWKVINYTITYELDGGQVTGNPVQYDVTKTFKLKEPKKTGYKFLGWYLDRGGEEPQKVTAIAKGTFGNLILTARWQENQYNIKFMGNGGSTEEGKSSVTVTHLYSLEEELISNSFSKPGYDFIGWNTKKDGKGTTYNDRELVSKLSSSNNAVITLYAMWETEKFWITYELNGDDARNSNPAYYTILSDVTLKNPVNQGYTFAGWYTDEEFTNKITKISRNTASDLTLYAKWSENTYNVAFNLNGGKGTVAKLTNVAYTDAFELPESDEIIHNGYILKEWNTKKDGKGTSFGLNHTSFKTKNMSVKDKSTVTLYAIWEPVKYTITYHLNGVESNPNPSYYTVLKDVTLKNLSNKGYTFGGWYTDEEFTNKITKISRNTLSDLTLYAKWSENTYNVAFNLNGGKGTAAKLTNVAYTDAIELPGSDKITRSGYSLKEWNTKKDGKGISFGLDHTSFKTKNMSVKDKSTVTLYAIWEPVKYTITYDLIGVESNPNPSYYTVLKDVTLKNLSNKGYTFGGWYTDEEFTNKITKISRNTASDLTLYAKWSENTYNVAFNLNGGKGTAAKLTNVAYTGDIELPGAEEITRSGYILKEWNTKSDGKGISFGLEHTSFATKEMSAKNKSTVTLYAIWEPVKYEIEYQLNGAEENPNPSYYTVKKDVKLQIPVKKGYTFLGWYSDAEYKNKVTVIKKETKKAVTLYAKWSEDVNVYNVAFNLNGGKGTASAIRNIKYGDEIDLPEGITKKGYSFEGWNTRKDGKGTNYSESANLQINVKNGGTITLYANWKVIEYQISYANIEGVTVNSNPAVYTIQKDVSLKTPVKPGYTFKGWFGDEGFKNKMSIISRTGAKDITVYAKWEINTYSVRFDANGGKGSAGQLKNLLYGENIVLPGSETFTREGYELLGWNTRKDKKGTSYATGEIEGISAKNKSTVTLYAVWKPIEHTITYLHKDESGEPVASEDITNGNPSVYTIEKNVWLVSPSKTGYTFRGWYTEDGKRVILIKRTKTEDITLHAVWKANTYTVRFNSNGGNGSMNKMSDCIYDKTYNLSENTYIKEGYRFVGWNTRRDGTGASYEGDAEVKNLSAGNKALVTLYAQWEEEE